MTRRGMWLGVLILFIAAAFRIHALSYGLDDVCLTVAEERWLYEDYQPVSLYRWNAEPDEALHNLPGRVPPTPLAAVNTAPLDRFFLRLATLASGLLTVTIVIRLGRNLRADWWWLAGLLVAVAPWFVAADRWTVRFDPAPFVVAISLLALWKCYRLPAGWQRDLATIIQTVTALSLLVIAPPLWWLTIALLLIQPFPNWRTTVFVLLAGIVLIPALQTPELWLAALQQWDVSLTATCLIVALSLALWWRRHLTTVMTAILLVSVVVAGGMTLYQDRQLAHPDANDWQLIRWLQARIPDNSVIEFDGATWPLAAVVACPVGVNVRFIPQSEVVEFFDVRDLSTPYYRVTMDANAVAEYPYVTSIGEQYWVGRSLEFNNPVDIGFGELVYLLSYEVLTPTVIPAGMVDIRIDYQFGANITPDVLAYAAFVHVTPVDDPGTKWANYTDPFFEESGNTGSRRVMLNHHIRFPLSPDIPPGSYDVHFGIFNVYTGETVGDVLILGEIAVE